MSELLNEIEKQREELSAMLHEPMALIARESAPVWRDREALDAELSKHLGNIPFARFLYAMNTRGQQISSNVGRDEGLISKEVGRDRSHRPYMQNGGLMCQEFLLSDAYISLRANRPSVTAIQVVRHEDAILGFLGCDFDLRDLPITKSYTEPSSWRQIKGDPAIRGTLFQQSRVDSLVDQKIDEIFPLLTELICDHGIFHCKLHFSSSRATIWLYHDPYNYRLLDIEALTDPDVCFVYPKCPYPRDARIAPEQVPEILQGFKELRMADETIYLRSGSLNIINGMIALNFSCDGSHYLSHEEFLDRNNAFWVSVATD